MYQSSNEAKMIVRSYLSLLPSLIYPKSVDKSLLNLNYFCALFFY
ncbi:hypothetical protein AsAng_0053010 [Aureispira anguillae]|uniref:Uncharacterized protein n=1 Tax=Aureispira anguillae TaxID=2864201 RepID=A0A915YKB2_9BACT|nr:hypothetical protein AsAng_0053010 [Aureispira anguillae]